MKLELVRDQNCTLTGPMSALPGLAENKCLSRHAHGARLLQVGEQDVALGAKFRAKVVLDIQVCF